MRILIINHFYPPVVDAHAYRWEQIARCWVAQGDRVDVISGRLHGVPDRGTEAGVDVTRVGVIARPLMQSAPLRQRAVGKRVRLKALLVDALRPIYRKVYWPDAWWYWWLAALREVWRRRHVTYDLVVSYCPCFGAHLAAAALQRWNKPAGFKWVADYGDPFSISSTMPPNNFALYGRLNRLAERHVAAKSDAVVFTNDSTAAAYRTSGVCSGGKVHVIPHLADVQSLYRRAHREPQTDIGNGLAERVTKLLYIGGFHRGIREPDLLFDLLRELNRNTQHEYILTIYGPPNGFDLSPADCPQIRYEGMIEREKVAHLIRDADVLVNVDNTNCVMVPSKVVEYIATGKPLLNLKSGGVDHPAVAKYVNCQFAIELRRDDLLNGGAALVAQFLARAVGLIAPLEAVEKVLEGHTLSTVAGQYRELALAPRP